jgi:hypothetical protein
MANDQYLTKFCEIMLEWSLSISGEGVSLDPGVLKARAVSRIAPR